MNALIIVDIQNDFLPGGALAVADGDKIIPAINELQKKFELVVISRDWHPANHGSFAEVQGKSVGEMSTLGGQPQVMWPVHCVQGTYGADTASALNTNKIARVFDKGTDPNIDSYSIFFDNGRLRSSGLDTYLKEKGVDELTVVGIATDYCVKFSVLDALSLGFKVTVIESACKGVELDAGDVARALNEMRAAGAIIA